MSRTRPLLLLATLVGCASPPDPDTGATEPEPVLPGIELVCINELMAHAEAGGPPPVDRHDWVELAGQPGTVLYGWHLLWDFDDPKRFPLDGLKLDDNGVLLLLANDDGASLGTLPIRLDADGEDLGLQAPDGDQDWVSWGPTAADMAHARIYDCCRGPGCWTTDFGGSPMQPNPTDAR